MYSSFEGVKIYLYPRDHNPPHFHAYYAEFEAMIDIRTLNVIAGEFPPKQLKKVQKWALKVQNSLLNEFIKLQGK